MLCGGGVCVLCFLVPALLLPVPVSTCQPILSRTNKCVLSDVAPTPSVCHGSDVAAVQVP